MSIQQKPYALCSRNYRAPSCALNEFGDGWKRNVFATGQFISLLHYCWNLNIDCVVEIDFRPIYVVCDNSALAGINTSDEHGPIDHRRAGVNGMVIAKNDSIMRKLIKRRRVFFADKIRSHPVPDDYDYMPLRFQRTGCNGRHAEAPQKQCDHSRHVRIIKQGAAVSSRRSPKGATAWIAVDFKIDSCEGISF